MVTVRLQKHGHLALPRDVRERLGLHEGDLLQLDVQGGQIRLQPPHANGAQGDSTPPEARDPDQAYFWSEAWQADERAAEADIAAGRTTRFANAGELIADLHRQAARKRGK